jgi:hypothetical protein
MSNLKPELQQSQQQNSIVTARSPVASSKSQSERSSSSDISEKELDELNDLCRELRSRVKA